MAKDTNFTTEQTSKIKGKRKIKSNKENSKRLNASRVKRFEVVAGESRNDIQHIAFYWPTRVFEEGINIKHVRRVGPKLHCIYRPWSKSLTSAYICSSICRGFKLGSEGSCHDGG